jgi:hypothetical protein
VTVERWRIVSGDRGLRTVTWDATDVKNSIYFYKMIADGKVLVGKMTLMK